MARTYKRDSNGRFAGGGGGSANSGKRSSNRGVQPRQATSPRRPARPAGSKPPKRRGLIPQRQAVANAKAKLAAKQADVNASNRSKGASKGALTRAQNKLAAAKQRGTIKLANRGGVIKPGRGDKKAAISANAIRPISARLQTVRQIKMSPKQWLAQEERNGAKYGSEPKPKPKRRSPSGPPRNGRVPYEPQTAKGLADAVERSARRRAGKPATTSDRNAPTTTQRPARATAAQRIKAMVNRRGTVSGNRFEHGTATQTMSLAEMRRAVRQHARTNGIKSKKDFEMMYALAAGVTKKGNNGAAQGRQPRTRSDWERIYRNTIGVPQSDRNRRSGPGIFRGIDIHNNSRARYVFGLGATATKDQINQAFRQLAKRAHPDAGGRAKDMARLTQMRDSLLAQVAPPKPAKTSRKRGKAATASTSTSGRPRGPLMLPSASRRRKS